MFGSPPPAASSSESSSGKSSSASTKYASSSRTSPQARPSASSSGNQSSCSTPTAWKHVRRLITARPSAWSRAADRALCMTATTTSSAASATSVKIIVLAFHSGADVAEATAVRSSSAPHRTSANGLQSPPSTSPSPRAATTLTSNRSLTSPIFRNLCAGLGGRRAAPRLEPVAAPRAQRYGRHVCYAFVAAAAPDAFRHAPRRRRYGRLAQGDETSVSGSPSSRRGAGRPERLPPASIGSRDIKCHG